MLWVTVLFLGKKVYPQCLVFNTKFSHSICKTCCLTTPFNEQCKLEPGGHCILFLSKTFYSQSASLLSPANFDLKGNLAMDKLSTQERYGQVCI